MSSKNHWFFSNTKVEVDKLPISLVIEKYIKVQRNRFGDDDGLCPFHGDTHFGNFKINNHKGIYKCFACDAYGDAIQFVRDLYDLSFKNAVMKIAHDHKIITREQAESYIGGKVAKVSVNKVSTELEIKEKPNGVAPLGSVLQRHVAYTLWLKNTGLSEEHRKYLKNRGYSDEEIDEKGFFSFPNPTEEFLANHLEACRKARLSPLLYKGVPGFHTSEDMMLETTHHKTGDREYQFTFHKRNGIGIPTKNAKGRIVGIQIRNDNPKDMKKRYTWFSSSYTAYDDNEYIFGSKAGAPTHISKPKVNKYPGVVFITEGFFKAETISKQFGCYAISVSGVGNYRSLPEDLKEVENISNKKINYVYVAYDADMSQNIQVYLHAKNMVSLIKETLEAHVYTTIWNESDGKGIDDLIQNGKVQTLKKVDFDVFESYYDKMINQFLKKYNKLQKVPKEVVAKTFEEEVLIKIA